MDETTPESPLEAIAEQIGDLPPVDPDKQYTRTSEQLRDGYSDGFKPLHALDLSRVRTFDDLVRGMAGTAFGGRALGESVDVLEAMVRDPRCLKVMTLSGAMTMAKMGLVICDMIDHGLVDIIVSTGALMCHGLVESAGMAHFKLRPGWDDKRLYEAGYCRVYDTLELERNLDATGEMLLEILSSQDESTIHCSHTLLAQVGDWLEANTPGRAILKSARRRGVPIFVPAFTDSELGLDFAICNHLRAVAGQAPLRYDPFLDLGEYCRRMLQADRIGIFTIGGGVPRNWAQQIGPLIDHMQRVETGVCSNPLRFRYGVRICPEPVHWGGLSGCTYSEGISWGKFVPPDEGGRYAEVAADATVAWPLVVRAVLERLGVEGFAAPR